MKVNAVVYETREVTLDTNFFKDKAGNRYRVFPSDYSRAITANIISADFTEFKKGELIGAYLLDQLEPIDAREYIRAAVINAERELKAELAATGEPVGVRIEVTNLNK